MRTISYILLGISGLAIATLYSQVGTLQMLGLSVLLFSMAIVLSLTDSLMSLMLLSMLSVALVGSAAYNTFLSSAFIVNLLLGAMLFYVWRNMHRVRPDEILVLSNKGSGRVRRIIGPDLALTIPLVEQPIARLPRYNQELELRIRGVNTQPRAGPYGTGNQNITLFVARMHYRLLPNGYQRILNVPNRDIIFDRVKAEPGFARQEDARLDTCFWVHVWQEVLMDVATKSIRAAIFHSALSPSEVRLQRTRLAPQLSRQIQARLEGMGLLLIDFTILQIEADEDDTALMRHALAVQAQERVREIELFEAVRTHALLALDQQRREAIQANAGTLSQRTIDLIVQGKLPNPLLASYVQSSLAELDQRRFDDV